MMANFVHGQGTAYKGRPLAVFIYGGAVLIFLIVPCLMVVPMSFSASRYLAFPPEEWSLVWYEAYFASELWLDATRLSIIVATLVVLVTLPLGFAAAYGLHHSRPDISHKIWLIYLLPLIVPHIFLAIGVFLAFSKLGLNNTVLGLVIAHSLLALPFVVVIVLAGLQQFNYAMELAARSLGATRLRAVLSVTVPQIRGHLVTAGLFAFIASFDEVLVAIFVSSGPHSTLPRRMFANIRDQVDPLVAVASSIFVAVTLIIVLVVIPWSRRLNH